MTSNLRTILIRTIVTAFVSVPLFGCGADVNVIPQPNEIHKGNGFCNIEQGIYTLEEGRTVDFLYGYLADDHGIQQNAGGTEVRFTKSTEATDEEGYSLNVSKHMIEISAASEKGWFYGIQTLRQLIDGKKIPCVKISDSPAFRWRAFMLDEARHFHGKETVKMLLDEMARLKMNTFHWHLTDDTGWRLEIKKYPRLVEIGSQRDSTQIEDPGLDIPGETGDPAYDAFLRRYQSDKFDPAPHKGYYTQEDIKEIVAYALDRNIRIVPEISMPGHASAAIASYPWLGTAKEQIKVPCRFGVLSQVYDPSSEKVMQFLKDVLKEVSELFPSGYIHIGGDEVKYGQWQESESVKQYMKDNGLASYRDVQVKMTNDICHYIEDELGCRMIGWNEILGISAHEWDKAEGTSDTKLSKKAIVQFWAGNKSILHYTLENGYEVVHSYCEDTYIDYSYEQLPLERAYSFNPVPEGFDKENIIGLGCQLWTEWVRDRNRIEYQTFPRIAAYAETGWTDCADKDYGRFRHSLKKLTKIWKDKGYNITDKY